MKLASGTNGTSRTGTRGGALVLVLAIVVLTTVVLVAAFVKTQLSGKVTRSQADGFSASLFAREGVEQVVAMLRHYTGDPDGNWMTRPGALVEINNGNPELIALHSGTDDEDVNMNPPLLLDAGEGLITPDPDEASHAMRVDWIYVRRDGARETGLPAYDPDNPVVGRYAFWTDDESVKLNTNTAWTRRAANPRPTSDPSQVSLDVLIAEADGTPESAGEDLADAIEKRRLDFGPFNSPFDVRAAAENDAQTEALRGQKLHLTHYNHSPRQRLLDAEPIALTTQVDLANEHPYFDTTDLPALVAELEDMLTADEWLLPDPPGSFESKFGTDAINQLAVNLIDYVKAAESSDPITVPTISPDGTVKGVHRGPRITELAVWRAADPDPGDPNGHHRFRFLMEVHLPENFGLEEVDLTELRRPSDFTDGDSPPTDIEATDCHPDSTLREGEYRVITWEQNIDPAEFPNPNADLQAVLYSSAEELLDAAPLQGTLPVPVTIGASGTTSSTAADAIAAVTSSLETDDPFLNSRESDWEPGSSTTFGAVNSRSTLGESAQTTSPEQDMDASGEITNVGIRMPTPAGTSGNPLGRVESLGEIGHVHTGNPWTTLRLQPRHPAAAGSGPSDWLLLDLFAAPVDAVTANNRIFHPTAESAAGKINLNVTPEPFDPIDRSLPLVALFSGISGFDPAEFDPEGAVENIIAHEAADAAIAQGSFVFDGGEAAFFHPGEIVEVAGVADSGEVSENVVRQIIDHVTVRTNVFGVFSIGQSLRQTPNGEIVIRGEERLHAIVERVVDPVAGETDFRILFAKPLSL